MIRKIFGLFLVSTAFSGIALATDVGIGCSENPLKMDAKDVVSFSVSGPISNKMADATLEYNGKEVSRKATLVTIQNDGKPIRYIVKDGDLTYVFSHLERCGDQQQRSDLSKVTITRTKSNGEKVLVEKLPCECDMD